MRGLGQPLILMLTLCVKCWAMSRSEVEDFSNFLRKTSVLDQNLKDGFGSDHESDEVEEVASDDAWEQSGKFEGDLILNDRQRRLIVEDVAEGLSRNGLKDSTKRWPGNEVTYYIQKEHFSSDQVRAIQDGIDDLAQASCVKFRPYQKGDRDAVVIQGSRRGCFSQVGYQGGYQVLNLSGRHPVGRGCFRHGTVVHELLHTLGFFHMQSSPDRDDYIDVVWENIVQPARHNFKKYNVFSVSDFGVGYDYESVLHYGRRAFSNNGQDTLVPKQGGAEIGQRIGLSDKDTQKLNKMYCDSDNNSDEDEVPAVPQKHHHKKKPSNQPFQGHGIGYHQGKALVIKLPAAETFSLTDKSIHKPIFDYFSKSPKAVLPKSVQEFGIGKKVNEHPVESHNDNSNNLIKELNKKHDFNFIKFTKDNYQPEAIETTTHKPEHKHSPKSNNSDIIKSLGHVDDDGDLESEKFNLHDHLTELDKIIKSRVYPSQKETDHVLFYMKEYDGFKPKSIETTTQKVSNIYSNNERDKSDSKESFTQEEDGDDFESSPFDGHVLYTSKDYDDKIPHYKNEYKLRQPQINKTTADKNNEGTQEFSKSESAESSAYDEDDNTFAPESVDDHFTDVDKVIKNKVKGDFLTKDANFLSFRNEYNRLNKLRKGSYFPMSVGENKSEDENNEDHSFLFSSEENNDFLIPKDEKKGNTYEYYSHEDPYLPNKSDAYAENKGINEGSNENPRNKEKNRFGDFSNNFKKLPYKYQPPTDSEIYHGLSRERHDDLIDKSIEENIKLNSVKIKSKNKQQEHVRTSPVTKLSPAPLIHDNIEDFDVDDTALPDIMKNYTHNDNKSHNLANDKTTSTASPKEEDHSKKESKLEVDPKSDVIIFNQDKSVEELEISPGEKLEPIKLQDKTKIIRQANFKTLTYSSAEKIDHYAPFGTVQPVRYEVINYLPYTSDNTYSPDTHDFDTYHIKNKYLSYPHGFPSDYNPYTYDSHYDPDFNKHSGSSNPHLFY